MDNYVPIIKKSMKILKNIEYKATKMQKEGEGNKFFFKNKSLLNIS